MAFNLVVCYLGFPNLSYFSLFCSNSFHFPPKNSRWQYFLGGLIFSNFWASWVVLAAAHVAFWEAQCISNTPRIISALKKSHEMVFNLYYISFFGSIFRSFPSKELLMGIIRLLIFLNTISSFWASWVVLAAAHFGFWGAQGISTTPGIIFAFGKKNEMVFNHYLHHWFIPRYFSFFHTSLCFSHIPCFSDQKTFDRNGCERATIPFSKGFFFQVVAAHFGFWGAQGISNTSKICFPLGNRTKWCSTWLWPEVIFLLFHIFPLSPIFFSVSPKEVSIGFFFLQFLGA